ncbi:hypothetical protein V8F06_008816 [Rhypophila decipiens]
MTTQTEVTRLSLPNMESTSQINPTNITDPATAVDKSVEEDSGFFDSDRHPGPLAIWLLAMYSLTFLTGLMICCLALLTNRESRDKIIHWRRSLQARFRIPRWLRVFSSTEPGMLRFDLGMFVVIVYFVLCVAMVAFPFAYCLVYFIQAEQSEGANTVLMVIAWLFPGCFASVALVRCVLESRVLETRDLEYAEERFETKDEEKGKAGGEKYTDTSPLLMSEV